MVKKIISIFFFIKNNFLREGWGDDNGGGRSDKGESLSRLRGGTSSVLKRLERRLYISHTGRTEKQKIRNIAEVCMGTEFESEFLDITGYTKEKVYDILQNR